MNNSRCWTDGLSFREQYDACWIMGNYNEAAKYIKDHPAYSLLPIRFYNDGDWNIKGLYNFSSVGTYRDGFELCRTSEICSSKIEFAYRLWEKAAEILVMEFPDIEEFSYGEQNENGVYPIKFRYDVSTVAARQKEIMKSLINDGFSIDEYIRISYTEEERRKTWHYEGIVGDSAEDLYGIFYKTPHGEALPIEFNKNVSFTYEECCEYYKEFDHKMLELGNQRKIYALEESKHKELFEWAENGDFNPIYQMSLKTPCLNIFNKHGETVFYLFAKAVLDDFYENDLSAETKKMFDILLSQGANISLAGVDECAYTLIKDAVIHQNIGLIEWLLENGADVDVYMHIDSLDCEVITLRDWLDNIICELVRYKEDEEFIELDKKIYSMLSAHSNGK